MKQFFSLSKALLIPLFFALSAQGLKAQPANDLCENAQVLPMSNSETCGANLVTGTTLGANDELGSFECGSMDGPWPDVFYTFNSGDYSTILINVGFITQMDLLISVSEACGEGDVLYCSVNQSADGGGANLTPQNGSNKNTDYIIRISTNSGYEGVGEFNICIIGQHLCTDSYGNQVLDPGDICSIWMGGTGIVNNDCDCVCPPEGCECQSPCYGEFFGGTVTLNGTNEVLTSVVQIKQCQYYSNIFEGDQYTFTANYAGGGGLAYITIWGGSGVLGHGYSPVTVTSDVNGSLEAHYHYDPECHASLGPGYSLDSSVQCITCDYDCPAIPGYFGDACDDGNPNTINDIIDADCNCTGEESESGSLVGTADWNDNCGDRGLTIDLYTPGTSMLMYSYAASIDANGDFDVGYGIDAGNYDIYAKLDGHIAKGYYNETISLGANTLLLGSFIPGDLNNDNGINISDFSLLNISFGSSEGDANFNFLADMNCDENINIIDVSILNISFGMVGAQP